MYSLIVNRMSIVHNQCLKGNLLDINRLVRDLSAQIEWIIVRAICNENLKKTKEMVSTHQKKRFNKRSLHQIHIQIFAHLCWCILCRHLYLYLKFINVIRLFFDKSDCQKCLFQ